MFILGITLAAIAYLQFGYHVVGKHSWRTWHKGTSKGVMPSLLFPFNALNGTVGKKSLALIADECPDEHSYSTTLAFIWPLKLAWAVIIGAGIGAFAGMSGALKAVVWLGIDAPRALVRKLTGAPDPKLALPPVTDAIEQEVEDALDVKKRFAHLEAAQNDKPAD